MNDSAIPLLILLAFGVLTCAIVLPIIAFVRTHRIGELRERIERLENAVQRLARGKSAPEEADSRLAQLDARLSRLESELNVIRSATTQVNVNVPISPPRLREEPALVLEAEEAPTPLRPAEDAARLEEWVGRQGLGWVAVVLLLFATGFFLKYAFENRWIGELGRVALGILAGSALAIGGWVYHRRGWRVFGQMLSSGGVMLLFLATYGAFGYYHLIPRPAAAVFLFILVAETAGLAALYDAQAIALMAVVGGLLNPLLLSTGHDEYRSLFTYLIILNAGSLGLTFVRRWTPVSLVALLGTQLWFWSWYAAFYHPEKMWAALMFQVLLFALYLGHGLASCLARDAPADVPELVRLMVNAVLFTTAIYTLLDEDYHPWMGTVMVLLATVYAGLGWLLQTWRSEDRRQLFVIVAISMGLVATAIPLQAHEAWIPVGWAVLGGALWCFGLRLSARPLRDLAIVPFVLAVGRLVLVDTPYLDRAPFVPLFNSFAVPAVIVSVCLFVAAGASHRFLGRFGPGDQAAMLGTGMAGIALVWFTLSVETYTYFAAQMRQLGADRAGLERSAQTGLSVAWACYAAIVLGVGFWLRSLALRLAALGIFGATLIKVFLIDMAGLPGLYRVLAFFILALMMGGAAWAYHRSLHAHATSPEEKVTHEQV